MITGIDVNQTVDFISVHDKSEPKTIWKLGLLDYLSYLKVSEFMVPGKEAEGCVLSAKYGIRGVENYNIPFEKESDAFLKTIPPILLLEIGAKVLQLSSMSGEETKNS